MLVSSMGGTARRSAVFLCLLLTLLLVPVAGAGARTYSVTVPRGLRAAASRATRADRRLVTDARALHACLAHAGRCSSARGAVQRAGRAFSAAERALAARAGRAGRRGARFAAYEAAPSLHAGAEKLSWTADPHVSAYVLVAEVPGQGNRYSIVHGTSTTPPPVPGETVLYMVRSAYWSSHWSNAVKISYPATTPSRTPEAPSGHSEEEVKQQAAPVLEVSGETLSWNGVAGVGSYVLMTDVPGQGESFTSVSGTSVTPPAVPGMTVTYSIRTAVDGSAWSPSVTIAYPAPPAEKAPTSEPSSGGGSTEGFQPGINSGGQQQDFVGASELGAKIVRIEYPIGAPASAWESTIASYAARGVRVAPLAGFEGRIPTVAEAQNLASWARAYGPGGTFWAGRSDGYLAIRTIEFGNETSYGYQYGDNAGSPSYQERARNYATRLKQAAEAISAGGIHVGLLAAADDWTGDWMNGMFEAVPNLGSYVAGWVSHPYGASGRTKLEGILKQTAAHGAPSNIPIDITEWGISTDGSSCVTENYGFNPCMSYAEAAEQLRRSLSEIKGMLGSRLGLFMLYQVRDQQPAGVTNSREAYFGLLQHEDQTKGPYTAAAQELLAL